MIYQLACTRMYTYPTIQEWHIGESQNLRFMLDIGFHNTIFISKNGTVEFYYSQKEIEKFEEALEKYLDEETFHGICNEFIRKINEQDVKIRNIVPHLTIFNEIDEYPEWIEEKYRDDCLRRLLRVRQSTESILYKLMQPSDTKNFIYFQGKIYPELNALPIKPILKNNINPKSL